MSRLSLGAALFVVALAAGGCNCGDVVDVEGDPDSGTGVGGGDVQDGGGEPDAGPSSPCGAPCPSGQFCSTGGQVCIPDGTCVMNEDCAPGTICDVPSKTCVPGSSCGSVEVTGGVIEPNLFISLDRSCSMTQKVGTLTRWEIAVEALKRLLMDQTGKIYFGLGMFPDITGTSCSQDAPAFPIGPGNESSISTTLTMALSMTDPNFPDGPCVTNIDTGISQAALDPAFMDTSRKGYVLLVTDGAQSGCNLGGGDMGTLEAIKALKAKGVLTFVIGFGGQVDTAALNSFADEGGTATGDPVTHYYKAEDQVTLDAALATIAASTLGCTYALTQTPPDPNAIYVFFENTEQVARDPSHAGGWDYDATSNQVTFYGAECDKLKGGQVVDLDIVFGCARPGIE